MPRKYSNMFAGFYFIKSPEDFTLAPNLFVHSSRLQAISSFFNLRQNGGRTYWKQGFHWLNRINTVHNNENEDHEININHDNIEEKEAKKLNMVENGAHNSRREKKGFP